MSTEIFSPYVSNICADRIFDSLEHIKSQSWPKSTLYVVATPIGNLGDITLRALFSLSIVDLVAVEDTRISSVLLSAYGIKKPLISAHKYSEREVSNKICDSLKIGNRVALISDAGTPVISDPGSKIIEFIRESGYRVIPIPGPSSVTTALMATSVTSYENPYYLFAGFIPTKHLQRLNWFEKWKSLNIPVVMFESPHRLKSSLNDLFEVYGSSRLITIARELTKKFEEISTFQLKDYSNMLSSMSSNKGEFVLILHSADKINNNEVVSGFDDSILSLIEEGLSLSNIVKVISKTNGISRSALYEHALNLISKNV